MSVTPILILLLWHTDSVPSCIQMLVSHTLPISCVPGWNETLDLRLSAFVWQIPPEHSVHLFVGWISHLLSSQCQLPQKGPGQNVDINFIPPWENEGAISQSGLNSCASCCLKRQTYWTTPYFVMLFVHGTLTWTLTFKKMVNDTKTWMIRT